MEIKTKPTETAVDVSVWDDQTGQWFDIRQARNEQDAREIVAAFLLEDETLGQRKRYQITVTTSQEISWADDYSPEPPSLVEGGYRLDPREPLPLASAKGLPAGSKIVARWFQPGVGYRTDEMSVEGVAYEVAGRRASDIAKELDRAFPTDTSWTVDLYGASGSYFQLFHGRLV